MTSTGGVRANPTSEPPLSERLRARRGFFRTDTSWMMGGGFDTDCIEAADALDAQAKLLEEAREVLRGIADFKGKTLISIEHGQPYSIGANAAFEEAASLARALLSKLEHPHDGQQ